MSLKPISADKLVKTLGKVGFRPIRQKGSHLILQHPDGRLTVIPMHPGEKIGIGLLNKILKDIGINREEFLHLLK